MLKKRLNLIISITIGLLIFGFFIYKLGLEAVMVIAQNINYVYIILFFLSTVLCFVFSTYRGKSIIDSYGKKIPFLMLFRQTIAGWAVSYITPAARVGGEPLRVYMLKKEGNIDLKTGTSSVIMDKFVELAGSAVFGLIGLILLMLIPNAPFSLKFVLAILIVFTFLVLIIFYYRTVLGKGSLSTLFAFLRIDRINRFKNIIETLEDIERKMEVFFSHHKKAFLKSCFFYILYGFFTILEFKFLLLSVGFNASIPEIILALTVLGVVSFIPVPAALGFLEAGQSFLFLILNGNGSIGLALSLMMRINAVLFIAIGFTIISYFTNKQLKKSF